MQEQYCSRGKIFINTKINDCLFALQIRDAVFTKELVRSGETKILTKRIFFRIRILGMRINGRNILYVLFYHLTFLKSFSDFFREICSSSRRESLQMHFYRKLMPDKHFLKFLMYIQSIIYEFL